MKLTSLKSILRIFLALWMICVTYHSKAQEKQLKHAYPSGEYQMEMWQLGDRDIEIRIEKNNNFFDSIDLSTISSRTTFNYQIGSKNRDTNELFAHVHEGYGKFYFSNYYEVFEYDLKEKKLRKILPKKEGSNKSYRIVKVLESGIIVFLQGHIIEHNKLLVEHSGGNKFIHGYYDIVNEIIESVEYSVINDINGGVYVQPTRRAVE